MKGKYFALMGTAVFLALTSNVAVAQSTKFPQLAKQSESNSESNNKPAAEMELAPDVMEILCKRFPLNSRCQAGAGTTENTPAGSSTTEPMKPSEMKPSENTPPPGSTTTPAPDTTVPGTTTPPDSGTPSSTHSTY
jgi:hypothetical protein